MSFNITNLLLIFFPCQLSLALIFFYCLKTFSFKAKLDKNKIVELCSQVKGCIHWNSGVKENDQGLCNFDPWTQETLLIQTSISNFFLEQKLGIQSTSQVYKLIVSKSSKSIKQTFIKFGYALVCSFCFYLGSWNKKWNWR